MCTFDKRYRATFKELEKKRFIHHMVDFQDIIEIQSQYHAQHHNVFRQFEICNE